MSSLFLFAPFSRGYKDFLEGAALMVIPRCETTLINRFPNGEQV